jgi:hypothetical protein
LTEQEKNPMSAIAAANSSATNAVALLLSNVASSALDPGTPADKSTSSDAAASRDPVDTVDLSDRAKATLAHAQIERVAADKLAALVQTLKGQGSDKTKSKADSTDPQDIFQKLSGGATGSAKLEDLDGLMKSLFAANKNSDGTYNSFSKTVDDVLIVPSTPQQVDDWYKTYGQSFLEGALHFSGEEGNNVLAEAVQNRTITLQSAADIPDLNFHNTWTLQGGEGGGSINGTSSYNHDASIFKDPTTNYIVSGDGTVISWAKPQAAGL